MDSDWYESASEYKDIILTSVVKEIAAAVFDTIKLGSEDNFSNEAYIGTLENKGVALAPFHDLEEELPAGLTDQLTKLQEDIVSGTIKVESPSSN